MELNEKNLELVVSEKSLGKLTTNAIQIKEMVLQMLPKYDIANYDESNVDQAKKDKALLNNSAKALNSKRIELEKEFLKPFEEFKSVISETVNLIGDATSKIDTVVKQSETKVKELKNAEIEAYWNATGFNLVTLSKVWDEKWLNKSTTMKTVKAEISTKICKINDDLATLEAIGEDVDLLKSLYLDTLNVSTTIQYSNTLRENRKKPQEVPPKETVETKGSIADIFEEADIVEDDLLWEESETFEDVKSQSIDSSADEEQLERIMRVVGTKEQLIALGDWMYENGIYFEKLENV